MTAGPAAFSRWTLGAWLLVCLVTPVAAADDLWSDPAFALYRQAVDAYNNGKPDQAAALLDRALERYPGNVLALELAGDVGVLRGRPKAAASHYARLIRLYPAYVDGRRKLAEALERADMLAEAQVAYAAALGKAPGDSRVLLGAARVALRQDRPGTARELLERYLKLKPGDDAVFLKVVDLYVAAGKLKQILPTLEKRANDTKRGPLVERVALLHFAKGKAETAALWLERAIAAGRATPENHFRLGTAQYRAGFLEAAAKSLLTALELRPKHVDAWYNLAVVYLALRKPKQALSAFQTVAKLEPDQADVYDQIADIYEYRLLNMAMAKRYREMAQAARKRQASATTQAKPNQASGRP